MSGVLDLLVALVGERPEPSFAAFLIVHVAAGLTAVVAGATAMLSPKRTGRHPIAGRVYCMALCGVCATAVGMATLRGLEDAYLVVLGTLALTAACMGYLARHYRWQGWVRLHIMGMGTSYIVLLTAFYVDNGPRLPVWDRLPMLAFWILPSLIGFPMVALALFRFRDGLRRPPAIRMPAAQRELARLLSARRGARRKRIVHGLPVTGSPSRQPRPSRG
jgi:uncharacterized membrane protein